jgi:prepilin-type N-terminal cleavage/methylation domain-containing protein
LKGGDGIVSGRPWQIGGRAGACRRGRAFSLVELICVIGIIGILIALLLPSLIRAGEAARTVKCLSSLRQLGVAFNMYAAEQNGYLPYPTSLLFPPPTDQRFLWFNAVDQYLLASSKGQEKRTGIAATRNYKSYKQCFVWDTFEGERDSGYQSSTKELARTYKMNAHLRRANPPGHAKVSDVNDSSHFVLMGDGVSLDSTGMVPDQWESGQFSMEVNDITQASPAAPPASREHPLCGRSRGDNGAEAYREVAARARRLRARRDVGERVPRRRRRPGRGQGRHVDRGAGPTPQPEHASPLERPAAASPAVTGGAAACGKLSGRALR